MSSGSTSTGEQLPTTESGPWQADPAVVAAQRRIRRALVIAQVLGGIGIGAGASMGSLIAYEITGDESLAGISRTVGALSAGLLAAPMVALAMRRGRRVSLTAGWAMAALGCLTQVAAVAAGSLPLLLVGLLVFGAGQAANLQSRFAAADIERPERRARSLSLVVWATTLGIVAGPNLAGPGAALGQALGLPDIAGAYLIGAAGLTAAAVATGIGLRPDPLLLAQRYEDRPDPRAARKRRGSLGRVMGLPVARLAFVALIANQTIMVTVMVLTPVHMQHDGHGLPLIGLTISLHTLGMFAFSPGAGWLADRWGTDRTMGLGFAVTLTALVCGAAGASSMPMVMAALFLLGLGWSITMISGSAMLNEAVPGDLRAPAQGLVDTFTNLGAAAGAGSAGVILALLGFAGLNLVAMLLVVPVALLALLAARRPG